MPEPTTRALEGDLKTEVRRRRTFAIISHPDAGKTTLTEKLLLFSGMIRTAGMVSGRKSTQKAASDWMSMEQERGISITASAMQFNYKDIVVNILDTPGHQDFSEDTYRTLTAADSVIMVLDAAKGIETQTLKLFDACRLRSIPVMTFINKMDMPGRDPIDLMAEVEDVLKIHASAINWPLGRGREFRGIATLATGMVDIYDKTSSHGSAVPDVRRVAARDLEPEPGLDEGMINVLRDELELMEEAGNPFDQDEFLAGRVTPVFFGSALTNFGVEPLFDAFIDIAPCPSTRPADTNEAEIQIDPTSTSFSAYVFKLQANMNPRHRDCVAFLRVNSGRFEKDMQVVHEPSGKKVRLARPHSLMVNEREQVVLAFPGDVIGIVSSGLLGIGDTLSTAGGYSYKPLPQFQPEVFAQLRPADFGKRKAIDKGLAQLASEGAIQILTDLARDGGFPFVAAVGRLQFEVLQYRLKEEYGAATELVTMPYKCSAWLEGDIASFRKPTTARLVIDREKRPMVLFIDPFEKKMARDNNPDHKLLDYA